MPNMLMQGIATPNNMPDFLSKIHSRAGELLNGLNQGIGISNGAMELCTPIVSKEHAKHVSNLESLLNNIKNAPPVHYKHNSPHVRSHPHHPNTVHVHYHPGHSHSHGHGHGHGHNGFAQIGAETSMGGYGETKVVSENDKEFFLGFKDDVQDITGVEYSEFEPIRF